MMVRLRNEFSVNVFFFVLVKRKFFGPKKFSRPSGAILIKFSPISLKFRCKYQFLARRRRKFSIFDAFVMIFLWILLIFRENLKIFRKYFRDGRTNFPPNENIRFFSFQTKKHWFEGFGAAERQEMRWYPLDQHPNTFFERIIAP